VRRESCRFVSVLETGFLAIFIETIAEVKGVKTATQRIAELILIVKSVRQH